jgi:hypothetical protein
MLIGGASECYWENNAERIFLWKDNKRHKNDFDTLG